MGRNPSHLDFTLAALKGSTGFQFPYQMNIAARHFDISLLSHFPCSFNCQPSLEIAKKNLQMMQQLDPSLSTEFEEALKTAVIYTESQGVFLLKNPRMEDGVEGDRLYYNGLMGTKDNQLCQVLRVEDFIKIKNKGRIVISGLEIKNIGIMIFR
ncbi:hypothetical protein HYU13_04120 [Candidatus Woesearchaeota archaeon]|nr:hypothetical protein [Candidatus Woesearchaeota archaeon]